MRQRATGGAAGEIHRTAGWVNSQSGDAAVVCAKLSAEVCGVFERRSTTCVHTDHKTIGQVNSGVLQRVDVEESITGCSVNSLTRDPNCSGGGINGDGVSGLVAVAAQIAGINK